MKALQLDCCYEPKLKTDHLNYNRRVENGNLFYKKPELKYVDYSIPEIKNNEVLIKVKKVGLCGTDYHCFETGQDGYILFSGSVRFPQIIGHEFTGVIENVGKNVRHLKRGDYVACESVIWCGYCTSCRKGFFSECENIELIGLTIPGALADYVVIPQNQVWLINPLINKFGIENGMAIGTLLEPFGCAFKGIFLESKINCFLGSYAAIYGAGPIGLGAAWLLKLSGARRIFIFEKNLNRINLAKSLGFVDIYNIDDIESISEFLLKETKNQGVFINIECSGAGDVIMPEIVKSIAPKGTIVYISRTGKRNINLDFDSIMSNGNMIIGSRGHASSFPNLLNIFLMPEAGFISNIITKNINLLEVKGIFEDMNYKNEGKIIVNV